VAEATEGAVPEKVEPEAAGARPLGDDEKDQTGETSLVASVPEIALPWRIDVGGVRVAEAVGPEIVIANGADATEVSPDESATVMVNPTSEQADVGYMLLETKALVVLKDRPGQ